MFYLKFPELTLAGSSPEILIKVTGDHVQLRPIAGTRPRGKTPDEDKALEEDLLGIQQLFDHSAPVDVQLEAVR